MKFFWDTSAVINAAISPSVESRLESKSDEHVARLQVFYEFFSTMTGRGVMGKDANGQPIKILFEKHFKGLTGQARIEWP